MKVIPQLQKLLYGTVVATGVAVSGALWYNRTVGQVKVRDYIEIYQSCIEKCLVTRQSTNAFETDADHVKTYTNYVASWVASLTNYTARDASGEFTTNYWVFDGYVYEDVYANINVGSYRVSFPIDTSGNESIGGEMTGDLGDRYIWNAYSNVAVSSFPTNTALEGDYVLATNGQRSVVDQYFAGTFLTSLKALAGTTQDMFVNIYTNTGGYWLIDFGPIRGVDPFARSCVIGDQGVLQFDIEAYTFRGDSMFNGYWYADISGVFKIDRAVTVTGSGFSQALLRDARVKWWTERSLNSTVHTNYDRVSFHNINPEISYTEFVSIDSKVLSTEPAATAGNSLARAYRIDGGVDVGSKFMTTNVSDSLGEYAGFTNYNQFIGLSTNLSRTNLLNRLGLVNAYVYHNPPNTNDLERLSKCLKEFQWTSGARGDADGDNWFKSGYVDGSNTSSSITNRFYGQGESTSSWADATSIAFTNFISLQRATATIVVKPHQVTEGRYLAAGGVETWNATIEVITADMASLGLYTGIVHSADFYVFGASPNSGDLPLKITTDSADYSTFDAFGTGITFGQYDVISSLTDVTSATIASKTLSSTNYFTSVSVFPIDPGTGSPSNDVTYWQRKGWRLDGSGIDDLPEIIIKWDYQYNN